MWTLPKHWTLILKPAFVHFFGNMAPSFLMCLHSGRWVIVGPNHKFLKKKCTRYVFVTLTSEKTYAYVACKSHFFGRWVEMGQFVYLMFSFLSPKRALLSKNWNIADRHKNLIYLSWYVMESELFGVCALWLKERKKLFHLKNLNANFSFV